VSLTSRVLPFEEWPKVAISKGLNPSAACIVVAEEDGRIVGSCAVFTWVHLDGLEVDANHQRKGDVCRRLLHETGKVAEASRVEAMVAGSNTDEMNDYLTRLGGTEIPATFFVVPMRGFFRKEQG
jgi:hypothetical protein